VRIAFSPEINHIIAGWKKGPTVVPNLAMNCFDSNSFQNSDIGSSVRLTRGLSIK
jgi:hypothetical protein